MFKKIGDLIDTEALFKQMEKARKAQEENKDTLTNTPDSSKTCEYGCIDGFIIEDNRARECVCMQQKRLLARMKNAMIPDEFENAEFHTYRTDNHTQRGMLEKAKEYLADFDRIRTEQCNSFGFIALFGEAKLREIKSTTQRAQMKRTHNNFGLGKTHLQMAVAKELIKRGCAVLCISDVAFMDELSKSRAYNDNGEAVNKLLGAAIHSPILVWDDIGKAKPSEFRLDMYYQIINERYKAKRPIIFSSNEDQETLVERIGDASGSRLLGMARGRLFTVEGQDYRLTGGQRAAQ